MEKYLSVKGERVTEKVIEKSRFITSSAHVDGEEQARAFLEKARSEYRDATHNCFAYIADDKGNFMRFSDDGEPQGTAGMPILEVIKNNKLRQTAVVVTRYFGGIKLGAGGLVRAYSSSASENLALATRVCYQPCTSAEIIVDYPLVDALSRFLSEYGCTVGEVAYADRVRFAVAVKSEKFGAFNAALVNKLNGRAEIAVLGEYMYPFEL